MVAHKRGQEALTIPAVLPRPVPSRDAIARRAYDIYVANGRRNGRAREDWLRAERELQKGFSGISVGESPERKTSDPRAKYSELLNGRRPSVDARLTEAVMGAAEVGEPGRGSDPAASPVVPGMRPRHRGSPTGQRRGEGLAVSPPADGRREPER